MNRAPDFTIGGKDNPYLHRWWLIPRNKLFNIYLHKIVRDDDDRALHDHPWFNVSIILKGSYIEVHPSKVQLRAYRKWKGDLHGAYLGCLTHDIPGHRLLRTLRKRFSIVFRRPTAMHRLEVYNGPVWTLFITGPVVREWGFHCEERWVPWEQFVAQNDHGTIGRGCE